MSIYCVSGIFKTRLLPSSAGQWVVFLLTALLVSGCSSSMTRVQTWEGEATTAGSALLKAPGEIRVASVNGRAMESFLMDDLALDYDLLPGETQVVFSSKTIWAKAGVVRSGESKVHVIETEPHVVSFTAQAGETYRFQFAKPNSRRDAETMIENFTGAIVNEAGDEVASFELWDGQVPASGNDLEQMKAVWQRASEEDKRSFLRWAFE
ncbi:DUF2057 family protein [Marinobacter sp.]|uniref:DUF2057 family protein n=1 Tax=Marinobacter sp. TaxID=50741 RepID=UPI0034A26234